MILVDTSVLIDALRSKDLRLLRQLRDLDAAICGVTRAEILSGSRDARHRDRLWDVLETLHQVAIPESLWDEVGDGLAALRLAGITVPFMDLVIAVVSIASGLPLWTRDKHFWLIQQVLSQLELLEEPESKS